MPSYAVTDPASNRHSRLINRTPFFYGWIILIVGTLGIVMMGPSQTFTVTLFVDSFVTDLGISRANVSLLYGLATLGASVLLPITGRLVDRYGTRYMILFVSFGTGLACMALSTVSGALTLFIGLLAIRFLGFGSMQLVSNNVIAQWFIRRRGMVMGISSQSLAISLFVFPVLGDFLIRQFTWRGAWVALGLLICVLMTPLGWLFFRERPEHYGLKPDGNGQGPEFFPDIASEENWTLAEARQTGVFWIFSFAFASMSMIMAGLVFHQISLFAERGLGQSLAIYAFQAMAIFSIGGNLAMGYLLDKVSARRLLIGQLILLMGTLILVQTMASLWAAVVFSALLGLVSGGHRVMDSTVWAKYFGRQHLGSIRGITMIGTVGGTALGAYPLGLSYDLAGTYAIALNGLLVLPVVLAVLTLFVRRPNRQQIQSDSCQDTEDNWSGSQIEME